MSGRIARQALPKSLVEMLVKTTNLDSKDARRRLAPRAKPYFRTIERGLHLGYRRLANGASSS